MLAKNSVKVIKLAKKEQMIAHQDIIKLIPDEQKVRDILEDLTINRFLAEVEPAGSGRYRITPQGEAYLETRKKEMAGKWIPYAVTTVITVAMLVNSIMARMGIPIGWPQGIPNPFDSSSSASESQPQPQGESSQSPTSHASSSQASQSQSEPQPQSSQASSSSPSSADSSSSEPSSSSSSESQEEPSSESEVSSSGESAESGTP